MNSYYNIMHLSHSACRSPGKSIVVPMTEFSRQHCTRCVHYIYNLLSTSWELCVVVVKQSRTKPSRVGRQANQPAEDDQFTVSTDNCTQYGYWFRLIGLSCGLKQITAPFEMGFTMREEDLEEYGVSLQEVLQHLLGYTWTAGWSVFTQVPSSSLSVQEDCLTNDLVYFQKRHHRNKDVMNFNWFSSEGFSFLTWWDPILCCRVTFTQLTSFMLKYLPTISRCLRLPINPCFYFVKLSEITVLLSLNRRLFSI